MVKKRILTGINIQWPISEKIISREKVIETRTYPIPEHLLGKEMALIETPGKTGKFKSRITAIIKFTECKRYRNKDEFYEDSNLHLVQKNSDWAWKDKTKYGWKVEIVEILTPSILFEGKKGIVYTKNIKL